METMDFDWSDVGFGSLNVGFWLYGCWVLVIWTMDFDWVDV